MTTEQVHLPGAGSARATFPDKPVLVFWETTRACELSCVHCRASAIREPLPGELSTEEGKRLIDEVASFGRPSPVMIFTGGDPLLRDDLFGLLAHATDMGVHFAVSPAASDLLNLETLRRLKASGASAISLSLDGPTEEAHDTIRREPGTFRRTVRAAQEAVSLGLNVQINTTVMRNNFDDIPAIFRLITLLGVKTWEVFFLVKVGRGSGVEDVSPEECETVCNLLYDASQLGITVRTVEAPFIRRVALQRSQQGDYWPDPRYRMMRADLFRGGRSSTGHSTLNARDPRGGDGIIFVGYEGSICPGGFLPLSIGNVREDSLRQVYRENPILRRIRMREFRGPCGECEYRYLCGGSRSRAFAASGDVFSSDPACLLVAQRSH